MVCPCKDCERKGCGTYHDECEEYQKYNKENREKYEAKLKTYAVYGKTKSKGVYSAPRALRRKRV